MTPIWVAFIISCINGVCTPKHYADKGNFSEEICLKDARNWAIFARLKSPDREYSYGCELVTYEPKRVK